MTVSIRDIRLIDCPTDAYDLDANLAENQKADTYGIRFRTYFDGEPEKVISYLKQLRENPLEIVKTMLGDDFIDLIVIQTNQA